MNNTLKTGLAIAGTSVLAAGNGGLVGYMVGDSQGHRKAERYAITGVRAQKCIKNLGEKATIGPQPKDCKGIVVHKAQLPKSLMQYEPIYQIPSADDTENHFAKDIATAQHIVSAETSNYSLMLGGSALVFMATGLSTLFLTGSIKIKASSASEQAVPAEVVVAPEA